MSDQCEQNTDSEQHTLILVEEDTLEDPEPYQVTLLEHPPGSRPVELVQKAHRELAKHAEEETGVRHRVVTEHESPALTKAHYEIHDERIHGGETA